MAAVAVSHVYPLGSRLDERGSLEVGGCDLAAVAREFGTPAYVYAEDGIRASTHSFIQTGQADSKFGFPLADVPTAVERCAEAGLEVRGLHAHIGSQVFELEAFEAVAEVLRGLGDWPLLNLGGGLGIAYTAADNLRPMLYDARYEAEIVGRFGGEEVCTVVGMHCESGDVLVRDVALDDPRPGDLLVIPATGAYGHAMANNYNAIPRPPVLFCRDGDARVVVRRETYGDLTLRDR